MLIWNQKQVWILMGVGLLVGLFGFGNGSVWGQSSTDSRASRSQLIQALANAQSASQREAILAEMKSMTATDRRKKPTEAEMKAQVEKYFQRLVDLNQNLRDDFKDRTSIVEDHLKLESDDVTDIVVGELVDRGLGAIAEVPVPGAKVVSEVLSAGMGVADKVGERRDKNQRARGIIEVKESLRQDFNARITALENLREKVLNDPEQLEAYSSRSVLKSSETIREQAGKAYEIALWKKLLPLRWNVVRFSDPSTVYSYKSLVKIMGHVKRDPNRLAEWHRRIAPGFFDGPDGWTQVEYSLGTPGRFGATGAPKDIAERIQSLGVSKKELFKGWGLPVRNQRPFTPASIPTESN